MCSSSLKQMGCVHGPGQLPLSPAVCLALASLSGVLGSVCG